MATRVVLFVCMAIMALVPGCQCWNQQMKNLESSTRGLKREIVLYDYQGHTLNRWNTLTVIDADSGGLTTFFDSTGARVLVNGGILVAVEKP